MELDCEFKNYEIDGINFYGCNVIRTNIDKPETEIKAFIGKHLEGKSNKDVDVLSFKVSVMPFVPRGLHKSFPNFKWLCINYCYLKKITREDLKGLEGLEKLDLSYNDLVSLPSDLLTGMNKLVGVSFSYNKLEYLSLKILLPIVQNEIQRVGFENNLNKNLFYEKGNVDGVESLEKLMELIDKTFLTPIEDLKKEEFAGLLVDCFRRMWTSGLYADLIIIGGSSKSKEFRVHKVVLASQSSVLARMFPGDDEVMTIKDFSVEAVEEMLRFIYTGDLKEEKAVELYSMAMKFDLKLLKQRTQKIIVEETDDSNAVEVFSLGHLHSSEELKQAAYEAIAKMFPDNKIKFELLKAPEDMKLLIEDYHELQKARIKMGETLKKFSEPESKSASEFKLATNQEVTLSNKRNLFLNLFSKS